MSGVKTWIKNTHTKFEMEVGLLMSGLKELGGGREEEDLYDSLSQSVSDFEGSVVVNDASVTCNRRRNHSVRATVEATVEGSG